MRRLAMLLALAPALLQAAPWQFDTPLAVTAAVGPGIFHHLESAGRRNIAVSGGRVAIAWEDARDGTPRIHLASKALDGGGFVEVPVILSGTGEAYEPSLAGLGDGRYALAWEEDGATAIRLLGIDPRGRVRLGEVRLLSKAPAGQVSLWADGSDLRVVWAERHGRFQQIRYARLAADALQLRAPGDACAVDGEPLRADQLYPTVAATAQRTLVAWEDRRPGHTIILAAQAAAGKDCDFSAPFLVSEQPADRKAPYGKGHGVARVALAVHGADGVFAAWADKRDHRQGYDIFGAALRPDASAAPNQRLQDDFGGISQQWHPTLAGLPDGRLVAAWDDKREGNADLVLSWAEDGGWSDDLPVPGASGPGEQQQPAMTLDRAGRLHLAWVERDRPGGPTRLRYLVGVPAAAE